jgi:hypothetical protein
MEYRVVRDPGLHEQWDFDVDQGDRLIATPPADALT